MKKSTKFIIGSAVVLASSAYFITKKILEDKKDNENQEIDLIAEIIIKPYNDSWLISYIDVHGNEIYNFIHEGKLEESFEDIKIDEVTDLKGTTHKFIFMSDLEKENTCTCEECEK